MKVISSASFQSDKGIFSVIAREQTYRFILNIDSKITIAHVLIKHIKQLLQTGHVKNTHSESVSYAHIAQETELDIENKAIILHSREKSEFISFSDEEWNKLIDYLHE